MTQGSASHFSSEQKKIKVKTDQQRDGMKIDTKGYISHDNRAKR